MTDKYNQKSKRWGIYSFGKHQIEMTPNIARNKEARLSYIMGYLAGKNADVERYELRRQRYDLPERPFNAGYRNVTGAAQIPKSERYACYLKNEKVLDSFEIISEHRTNPFSLGSYRWNEEGVCIGLDADRAVDDFI